MKEVKKVLKSLFKQYPRACLLAVDFLAEEWKNRIIAESKACHKLIGKVSKEDGGVNRGRFFPLMQTLQGIQMMAYSTNNPNVDLLNQLTTHGVELIVCGQSVMLRELSPDDFLPNIQFALSAKTTLSKYQNIGYILFDINEK